MALQYPNPSSSFTPEVLISVDAEKAFDWVDWDYVFYALQKFVFGNEKYFLGETVIYLYINQSYPLRTFSSRPLLFTIAIKPLSVVLLSHS